MSLTSRQAEIWSNQGAVELSKKTYNSIKACLEKYEWPEKVRYKIYLQGSYRNSTNIRGDSDVDIVIQFNSTFYRNLSRLNSEEETRYEDDHVSASTTIHDLKGMTLKALYGYYNQQNVKSGDKSIKVNTPYLDADVVPSLQYRYYLSYDEKPGNFIEGIAIYAENLQRFIVNFPKIHIENGATKNKQTNGNYKPMIRLFKNARNMATQESLVISDQVPSYYIECLMYNVPDRLYGDDYVKTTDDIIDWLSKVDFKNFKCQHDLYDLFGDRYDQWDENDCTQYINSLVQII